MQPTNKQAFDVQSYSEDSLIGEADQFIQGVLRKDSRVCRPTSMGYYARYYNVVLHSPHCTIREPYTCKKSFSFLVPNLILWGKTRLKNTELGIGEVG